METKRMRYAQYKKHYADCETVPGSYNAADKTIEVLLPEGRVKPSGVRGEHFHNYQCWFIDHDGKKKYLSYRAVSYENALKQHLPWCKENGWTPCEA